MNSKLIAVLFALIIVVAGAGTFIALSGDKGDDSGGENTVKDALGREVNIPSDMGGGIVTIGGTGPLRFASMFDVYDNVIEVDKGDITDSRNGRAYSYAFDYYRMDPKTQSHADNSLDASTVESIVNKNPSLIITTESIWKKYSVNFEILSKQCNTVVLKDQQMKYMTGTDGNLADYFTFNVKLLGKILSKEERAEQIVADINDILSDIKSLNGVSDSKVYVAGVTINGSNSLNTTFPIYIPFTLANVSNAYNLGSTDNKVVLTEEEFTTFDIDMMVVDPSSSDKIKGNISSQKILKYIYGINNDDSANNVPIYITFPIVWDSINYDCALVSTYYISHLVHGNLTLDEVKMKVQHIFDVFYGEENAKNIYSDMESFFVIKSSGSAQSMPLLGEVKVAYDESNNTYYFTNA